MHIRFTWWKSRVSWVDRGVVVLVVHVQIAHHAPVILSVMHLPPRCPQYPVQPPLPATPWCALMFLWEHSRLDPVILSLLSSKMIPSKELVQNVDVVFQIKTHYVVLYTAPRSKQVQMTYMVHSTLCQGP